MKSKKLESLKILYLSIFVLTAVFVALTHLLPQPLFMPFRFPHYLEMMRPFLGISWPMSFEIYHYVLYTLAIIGSLNALGILFYPKFKQMALISSLTGLFLIPLMVLFLFLQFIKVNPLTAVIYGFYCVALLIVDWLTFKALTKEIQPNQTRQKEVSRE